MRVAVLGATGAVGQEMLATLESRKFPVSDLVLLASRRSAGARVNYGGVKLLSGRFAPVLSRE